MIRYFKEYYLLQSKYQDITQTVSGVGLVGGILLFWNVLGPQLALYIRPDTGQEYTSWKVALMFLGLPLSIWLVLIAMALLQVAFKKITLAEALAFSCRFTYPDEWKKQKSDIDLRTEKSAELNEKRNG